MQKAAIFALVASTALVSASTHFETTRSSNSNVHYRHQALSAGSPVLLEGEDEFDVADDQCGKISDEFICSEDSSCRWSKADKSCRSKLGPIPSFSAFSSFQDEVSSDPVVVPRRFRFLQHNSNSNQLEQQQQQQQLFDADEMMAEGLHQQQQHKQPIRPKSHPPSHPLKSKKVNNKSKNKKQSQQQQQPSSSSSTSSLLDDAQQLYDELVQLL